MDTPKDVAGLLSDLRDRGFETVHDETYESRGSRIIELGRRPSPRQVTIVCDRGIWAISIYFGSVDYDLQTVQLAIDRAPYSSRAMSHAERRAATVRAIDELSRHPL